MPNGELTKIAVFYDGNFFYNVSNYYYYHHARKARIDISQLHQFIKKQVAFFCNHLDAPLDSVSPDDLPTSLYRIVDTHYFRGRLSASYANEKNLLKYERAFDDVLISQGITTHYLPITSNVEKMHEKGIDVWLALEALESAIYKKFDVLVLISGDEDFLPLIRKLNALGVRVMLLGWNYEYTDASGNERQTKSSARLMSEATHVLKMNELIDNPPKKWSEMIGNLFISRARSQAEKEKQEIKWEQGKISRLCNGFGFISADGKPSETGVFFHYSALMDVDFYDLAAGMDVEYTQKQGSAGDDKAPPAESVRLDKK